MFETLSIGAILPCQESKQERCAVVAMQKSPQHTDCKNASASRRGKSPGVLLLGYEVQENQGSFALQKGIVSVTGAETVKTFSSMRREQERG